MISENDFLGQKFVTHGIIEKDCYRASCRVKAGWQPMQVRDDENTANIREKLRNLVYEMRDEYKQKYGHVKGIYALTDECCKVPANTLKSIFNGKNALTRRILAKICVGYKLGVDRANEFFLLVDGALNLTNDFDYITYHALKDGDDIDSFIEEVYRYMKVDLSQSSR